MTSPRPHADASPPAPPPASTAAVSGLWLTASQMAGLVFGLVLMSYLARRLGLLHYGLYALAMLWLTWSGALISGYGTAAARWIIGRPDAPSYATTLLQTMAGLGLALGALLWALAPGFAQALAAPELTDLLKIVALLLPLNALATGYGTLLNAQGHFGVAALRIPLAWSTQLLAAFALIESGQGARGALLAQAIPALLSCAIGRRVTHFTPFSRQGVPWSLLWRQNRALTGLQIAMQFSQTMDLFALKYFGAPSAGVGLYVGAQNVAGAAVMIFSGPLHHTLVRTVSLHLLQRDNLAAQRSATSALRLALLYAGALLAQIPLSSGIALLLLGPAFTAAGPLLAILLAVVACRIVAFCSHSLLIALGQTSFILPRLLLLIALSLIGFALLIPLGGAAATAAVALLLALLLAALTTRQALRSLAAPFPWDTLARSAAAALLSALLSAGLAPLLPQHPLAVILKLFLATALYAALLLALREPNLGLAHRAHLLRELLPFLRRSPKPSSPPHP